MPYDPDQPQNGQALDADALRVQLQGLFEAISSIPKGDQGDPGEPGPSGNDGGDGPPGPPFAQAVVDSVTTVDPGQDAGVSVSFDGSNVHFSFDIPRGTDGAAGSDGSPGNDGSDGAPGEVSLQQMKDSTSANTNGVSTLDTEFVNDPPTAADMETLRAKLNELILALRQN